MDKASFLRAREHLEQARRELADLRCATNHETTKIAWTRLLIETQRVYSKLAHGSSGPSAGWVGRLTHERKKDPLLLYVHHARHADEHGVERVTYESSDELLIKIRPGGTMSYFEFNGFDEEMRGDFEHGARAVFTPSEVRLVRVLDSKRWYEVPKEHLGEPINHLSPLTAGELLLAYLDAKLSEGEQFVNA